MIWLRISHGYVVEHFTAQFELRAVGETVISWGDSRLGNLIFNGDQLVEAILDWEMVGLGCREIDLGWWILVNRFHTIAIGLEPPPGFLSERETIDYYQDRSGYQPRNIDYFVTFAAFRLSIIFIRLANMMIDAGLLPTDASMATSNPVSNQLATCIGEPLPDGDSQYFVGNR